MRTPADWDERYATKEGLLWGAGPNRFVEAAWQGVAPTGRALDLACGEGRNAIWLAEQGWEASGVDFSPLALKRARGLARERGVEVEWIEADVAGWEPEAGRFSLVIVAYLQIPRAELKSALERAVKGLARGGEVFMIGHARRNLAEGVGGPKSPAVLWDPEELREDLEAIGLVVDECAEVMRPVAGAERDAIDLQARARRG